MRTYGSTEKRARRHDERERDDQSGRRSNDTLAREETEGKREKKDKKRSTGRISRYSGWRRQQTGGHIKAPTGCPSFGWGFPRVFSRMRVRARESPRGSAPRRRCAAPASRDGALIPVEPVLRAALRGWPWTHACACVRSGGSPVLALTLARLAVDTEGIMSQHPPETLWNDRVVASARPVLFL